MKKYGPERFLTTLDDKSLIEVEQKLGWERFKEWIGLARLLEDPRYSYEKLAEGPETLTGTKSN